MLQEKNNILRDKMDKNIMFIVYSLHKETKYVLSTPEGL